MCVCVCVCLTWPRKAHQWPSFSSSGVGSGSPFHLALLPNRDSLSLPPSLSLSPAITQRPAVAATLSPPHPLSLYFPRLTSGCCCQTPPRPALARPAGVPPVRNHHVERRPRRRRQRAQSAVHQGHNGAVEERRDALVAGEEVGLQCGGGGGGGGRRETIGMRQRGTLVAECVFGGGAENRRTFSKRPSAPIARSP